MLKRCFGCHFVTEKKWRKEAQTSEKMQNNFFSIETEYLLLLAMNWYMYQLTINALVWIYIFLTFSNLFSWQFCSLIQSHTHFSTVNHTNIHFCHNKQLWFWHWLIVSTLKHYSFNSDIPRCNLDLYIAVFSLRRDICLHIIRHVQYNW